MCRLYGFHATGSTRVECTLIRAQNALLVQSRSDLRGIANPDGWGIAYYDGSGPVTERRARPAFEDLRFSETAERVRAETVVAHVRAATVGGASLPNTHPFRHGPWTFAHKGTLTAFDRIEAGLEAEIEPNLLAHREGSTDSEVIFLWLMSRLASHGLDPAVAAAGTGPLVSLLSEVVPILASRSHDAGADEPAKLNLLLTDGVQLAASRWGNTLHWVERQGVYDCEVCAQAHADPDPGSRCRAAVVASEPISKERWNEVPEGSVVAVDAAASVAVHRIPAPSPHGSRR